jgi:hypothetical protein
MNFKIKAMKKLFILSMLGIMMMGNGVFAATSMLSNPSPAGVWVKFIFNFHKPKWDCLRGFGLCFDIEWGLEGIDGQAAPQGCIVKGQINDMGHLVVEIAETDLLKYENGASLPFFKNQRFITIDDPYTLSLSTCKALGLSSRYTVKPGNYPLTFSNGVYTVVF